MLICALSPRTAAKLVPIGFGIKKLQMTAVIEDAKVSSIYNIIEDELVQGVAHPLGVPLHREALPSASG